MATEKTLLELAKTMVLSDSEVKRYKEEGLIASNIDSLSQMIFAGGKSMTPAFYKSLGIKETFIHSDPTPSFVWDSYYLTDFFLIVCKGFYGVGIEGHDYPKLSFIPLEYVEKCELQFDRNYSGYIAPTYTTKKKSPVKGAVIGGALAGPTGAVIGAAAGSGEKTVMTSAGGSYNDDHYSLVIKLHNNGNEYRQSDFDKRQSNNANKEIINQKNRNSRQLISTAKSTKDLEAKKKPVEASLKSGGEAIKKENNSNTVALIIGIIVIVGLVILMSQL